MNGGRVRRKPGPGVTPIIDSQLSDLHLDHVLLGNGESIRVNFTQREYAIVLIEGALSCTFDSGRRVEIGPRGNPFSERPWVIMTSGPDGCILEGQPSASGMIASSPITVPRETQIVTPEDVRENLRGEDNWRRLVRLVCWSDNTTGEQLMIGETVVPSGNWATMPPHRHDRYEPGRQNNGEPDGEPEEVPYREIYYYRFSRPHGFGMCRQFDDDGTDNAFTLLANDAVYIDGGYHPVVCAPGADM
jgi:5-deoxy-glucuronate isomerase